MKITILDFLNQDPGLKILFPDADYYVFKTEDFSLNNRMELYKKYGLSPHRTDIENCRAEDEDHVLFVVAALYNSCSTWNNKINTHFSSDVRDFFFITLDIIRNGGFKSVYFFDNYDYDYDPNHIFIENRVYDFISEYNVHFFKRFYAKDKIYCDNVYSYPYILFGYTCITDIIGNGPYNSPEPKIKNMFFSGALHQHNDDVYGVYRNRREVIQKIYEVMGDFLIYKTNLSNEEYNEMLKKYAFCLDLLGVGEPNKRTFEILASGSLLIQQRSRLEWNFDDDFCEETYYDDHNDLFQKMKRLVTEPELYKQCLEKQNDIVQKNMSFDAIRKYIMTVVQDRNVTEIEQS